MNKIEEFAQNNYLSVRNVAACVFLKLVVKNDVTATAKVEMLAQSERWQERDTAAFILLILSTEDYPLGKGKSRIVFRK